jgi:hypothetical protein
VKVFAAPAVGDVEVLVHVLRVPFRPCRGKRVAATRKTHRRFCGV